MKNIKKYMTAENLMQSYYDSANDFYDLQFDTPIGTIYMIARVPEEENVGDNEFYWCSEENLARAVATAEMEDIEINEK